MEALSLGLDLPAALAAATGTAQDLDELQVATLSGLLGAYAQHYGADPSVEVLHREVEFETSIDGSRTFHAAGKIDGLGRLAHGRLCLVEYKTTSSSLEPDSDYWLRLRADTQILQYACAARAMGWEIGTIVYDVTRKPAIRPWQAGRGSDRRVETAEEFGERLRTDALARPGFYFCRREVPVMDDDLVEFVDLRRQVGTMILDRRAQQRRMDAATPWRAWPRHVNGMQCPGCEFAAFCLQNSIPDLAHPPAGYALGEANSELQGGAA